MQPLLILLIAQAIFSTKDLLARILVKNQHFGFQTLHRPLFYLLVVLHLTGFILQLYVLSNFHLSRSATGFAVLSIIFASTLGWLVLGEQISGLMYLAIVLAFASFLVLAFAKS